MNEADLIERACEPRAGDRHVSRDGTITCVIDDVVPDAQHDCSIEVTYSCAGREPFQDSLFLAYFRRMARAAILRGHTFTPVESKE
jgi:hypothetical protein